MLEHTRTLFTGQSDEPCLGVDRLAPTNSEADPQRFADSGADPLLPAGSGAVLRFLGDSGTVLPTSTASEVGPRTPLAERGTCTFGAPLPRMTKDWRHRGAALASTPYGVHSVNAGVIDFALGERSAGSLRPGGRSCRRDGGARARAPPAAWVGRPV
jgi:hypothetical protein